MNILKKIFKILWTFLLTPIVGIVAFLSIWLMGWIIVPIVIILDSKEVMIKRVEELIDKMEDCS